MGGRGGGWEDTTIDWLISSAIHSRGEMRVLMNQIWTSTEQKPPPLPPLPLMTEQTVVGAKSVCACTGEANCYTRNRELMSITLHNLSPLQEIDWAGPRGHLLCSTQYGPPRISWPLPLGARWRYCILLALPFVCAGYLTAGHWLTSIFDLIRSLECRRPFHPSTPHVRLCDLSLATFSVVSEKSVASGLCVFAISLLLFLTDSACGWPYFAVSWKLLHLDLQTLVLQTGIITRGEASTKIALCVDSVSVHFHCRSGPVGSCDLKWPPNEWPSVNSISSKSKTRISSRCC